MQDVEKIFLGPKERKLLKYIENHGLWVGDRRVESPEFHVLESYGLVISYLDRRFDIEYVEGTDLPEDNAYKANPNTAQYWRYTEKKDQESREEFKKDVFLLIVGGLITLVFEHIGDIHAFILRLFNHG